METRTLVNRDGFGFVDRSDEDVACAGGNPYCQMIDDAAVYYKILPKDVYDRVYDIAVTDRVNYPNFPPGRIPAFYRIQIISRKFRAYANRPPKIGEIITLLDIVEGEVRGLTREDDYQLTDIMIRSMLSLSLQPPEKVVVDAVAGGRVGRDNTGSGRGGGGGSAKASGSKLPLVIGGVAVLAVVGIALARRGR